MASVPYLQSKPFGPALDIAELLIEVAAGRGVALTHQRVQILLYYAQGYSLALLQALLFPEPIQVGETGPFVQAVEDRFAYHGNAPIPVSRKLQPNRQSYHPSALLGTVLHEFEALDDDTLLTRLRADTHWQASCKDGAVVDSRLVASWWCDKLESRIRNRESHPVAQLDEYLDQNPALTQRLCEAGGSKALNRWR